MTSEIIGIDAKRLEAKLDEGFARLDRENEFSVRDLRERVFSDLNFYFACAEKGYFTVNLKYVEMRDLYGCK